LTIRVSWFFFYSQPRKEGMPDLMADSVPITAKVTHVWHFLGFF